MNDKFKELTVKLTNTLKLKTYKFLLDSLKEEEHISDLINLILSGHLSSAFTCMKQVVSDNKGSMELVDKFIDDLQKHISSMEYIKNIEVL